MLQIQEEGVRGLAAQTEQPPVGDPQREGGRAQCQRSHRPAGHTQSEFPSNMYTQEFLRTAPSHQHLALGGLLKIE